MKFALVGPAYPHRGGIAQYTSSLYRTLAARHETLLVSFQRQYPGFLFPGRTQDDSSGFPLKVPAERMLDSLAPRSWARTGHRIAEFSPDALIFQWWQPFFAMSYRGVIRAFRSRSKAPVLFLCHNIYSHEERPWLGKSAVEAVFTRQVFRMVDGFLVHAEKMIPAVRALNPRSEVRRIYHPLYDFYLEYEPSGSAAPAESSGAHRLLFFGKIRRYKGLKTFLRALGELRDRLDFQATIAGEFYVDPEPYYGLVRELRLEDRIHWMPEYIPNEKVPALFRATDLVVLPYTEATQSGVVPVAYQFGVPVIATDVGGLAEVVLQGETGYLVPPRDFRALAERIFQFFSEGRKQQFQSRIEEFRSRLSWGQVEESIAELANELTRGET